MFWRICVLFTLVASCAAKAITLQVTGNRAVVGHRVASAVRFLSFFSLRR